MDLKYFIGIHRLKIIVMTCVLIACLLGVIGRQYYQNNPNTLYKKSISTIENKSTVASQRSEEVFSVTMSKSSLKDLIPTEVNGKSDSCSADKSYTNTNVFEHLFPKLLGKSMHCDYVQTRFYYWKKTPAELAKVLKSNIDNLDEGGAFPMNSNFETAGIFRSLNGSRPKLYLAFGKATDTFLFTNDLENLYSGRINTTVINRIPPTLPLEQTIQSFKNQGYIILQVSTYENYYNLQNTYK